MARQKAVSSRQKAEGKTPANGKATIYENGSASSPGQRWSEFTTARGVLVRVLGIPALFVEGLRAALESEWEAGGRALPTVPTYTTTNVAGEKKEEPHDPTTLDTAEEKAAWAVYQAEQAAFDSELSRRTLRYLILQCTEFKEDPAWARKHKAMGLTVPAEMWARKLYFAQTEVLGNRADIAELMRLGASLTGVDAALVQAADKSFRRVVEGDGAGGATEPEG